MKMSAGMSVIQKIITSLVTIIVLSVAIPILYPLLISGLTTFGTLGNFTFSGLFDATTGIVVILVSAGLLALLIAVMMKVWGKGSR
jgi:hypothetical protein